MIRDDFVLRLIRQAARSVARALGLARQQEQPEAFATLEDAARGQVGLALSVADVLPADQVLALLSGTEGLDVGRAAAFAALLGARATIAQDQGDLERFRISGVRALELWAGAVEAGLPTDDTDVGARMDALAQALGPAQLAPQVLAALATYAARQGRLADAEDWLGVMLDRCQPGAVEQARAFYGRLLSRPEAELEAGGLTRDEVRQGLASLT
ncbi:MAG: hypothetical protein H6739_39625 [Alphaproteobacteria bacterium]|nr:hypothetical protein [Alphaproteobacteria bacterium]